MNYFERFKARMKGVAIPYADEEIKPTRPITGLPAGHLELVNQIVDGIIGCRMRGVDYEALHRVAEGWATYEWEMVEPAFEARKAAKSAAA